jgi:uncharacterized coiled-coil protein SlyX
VNCSRFQRIIEDYHYGELEEQQSAEAAVHLGECAKCRSDLALLEAESRLYEAYAAKAESGLELDPGMWQRVAAGAASQPARFGKSQPAGSRMRGMRLPLAAFPWIRQAVAAVLLVAVSVTATWFMVERHHRANETSTSMRAYTPVGSSGGESLESALQSIQRAEKEYIKAIQELNGIVAKQESTLDPRMVAEMQANLRAIDERIAMARKAYYAHPTDAELAVYMLAAYSRKVEFLQDLTS